MIVVGLLLVGLGPAWYVVAGLEKQINIVKSVVLAVIAYLASHIVLSGLLFWIDQYSIKRTLLTCACAWGAGLIVMLIRKKRPQLTWEIRQYWLPCLIAVLILPFVFRGFEFYGMGQDEGVYQTQAICFINGMTERQYDFPEYYSMGTPGDQELYEAAIAETNLVGFYRIYNADGEYCFGQSGEQAFSERSGVFHGIPTYVALLALWGKLFGIRHMSGINIVILICCVFMLHEVCMRLKMKRSGEAVAMLVFACSPLIIWITKSSLTEIGMTLNWLVFLYLILGEDKRERVLSALCIWVYAFYHISVYVFMPFYVLLYLALYLYTKDRVNIKAMLLAVAGYLTGYWMSLMIAARYLDKNYVWIYRAGINGQNVPYVITAVCALVLLAGVVLLRSRKQLSFPVHISRKAAGIWIRIGMVLLILIQIYRSWKKGLQWQQLGGVTMITFLIVSGILVPLLVYGSVLFSTGQWLENWKKTVLLGCFFYCVLVFSAIFLPGIAYCYYYARYLTMYVPLLAIMGGLLLQQWSLWKAAVVTLAGVLWMLPYNITLLKYQDDTRVEWDTLEQVAGEIRAGDNVIIDVELFGYYYFPIKAMTGANIYPVLGDFEEESRRFYTGENQVWYLTVHGAERAENAYACKLSVVNHKSEDYNVPYSDWQNPLHDRYLQLPRQFRVTEETVLLYQYQP